MNKCFELHKLFNGMKRYNYKNIDTIPFNNGVYIFFGENEKYNGMDRIIRVGTDTGQNNLKSRMKQHFLKPNKDRSIFRKNIGRALLNKNNETELYNYWNLDLTSKEQKEKYFNPRLNEQCKKIENEITNYLCKNMEFVVFNLETKKDRLRFEEAIISTLYHSEDFIASKGWLGNYVPTNIIGNHVVNSRMWISQGIKAKEITDEELEKLKRICMQ